MGFSCFSFGSFFNLLSRRHRCALHRLWKRLSPCKRLVKLWKKRLICHGKFQEKRSIREQAGRKMKKQQKGKFLPKSRSTNGPGRSLSIRQSFERIPSWSRFMEESVGSEIVSSEIVSTALAVETQWAIDMSQLFLGQKFAYGAHSRLYHGIYQNRTVAVKLIMPPYEDLQLSSQLNRQFLLEVTLLSRLRHNNVIEFVGACKRPPIFCVITKYLNGGSLKAFLHKSEPDSISLSLKVRMALDVATGMEYLHSQGIIHRDLKSDNLLMTDDYHLKIADFGISCLESQTNSMKGFMGTYRWMAPEMIKAEICSKKVDVYSYGIVLWEICTSLIPFGDMTPMQAAFAVCQEKARPSIPDRCPEELAKLMQQCWCNNPTKRPEFFEIVNTLQNLATKEVRS